MAGEAAALRGQTVCCHDSHLLRGIVWPSPQSLGTRIKPFAGRADTLGLPHMDTRAGWALCSL